MALARTTRASKWPASPLVGVYALTQALFSFLLAQSASTDLDAHFIARGVLHLLSCVALLLAASTRVRNVSVASLAASLAFLVDAGVRALAASTALASTTREAFPPASATEFAQLTLAAVLIVVLRRREEPLFAASLAHAIATVLARIVDSLPLEGRGAAAAELVASIVALVAATNAAKIAVRALLGTDSMVTRARRVLDDVAREADFVHVWRDEARSVRALVQLKARDHAAGLMARSRIKAALAEVVDDVYVHVEPTHGTIRGISPSTE